MKAGQREYVGARSAKGPLLFVEDVREVGYNERVEMVLSGGQRPCRGVSLKSATHLAVIEVFEGTSGLAISRRPGPICRATFPMPVCREMLGRVFDGLGRPLDGGPPPVSEWSATSTAGPSIPSPGSIRRIIIQTGISAIDGMNTLVRGQKLPMFSLSGLPHNDLAGQIIQNARIADQEKFALVFAAIGVKHDVARRFQDLFEAGGATEQVVMFLNLADDPSIERLLTPAGRPDHGGVPRFRSCESTSWWS